jgi:hypothetical protein
MPKVLNFFLAFFLLFIFAFLPGKIFASDNSFVTVVNPVRISSYINHPEKSLAAEYEEIRVRNLPATWLLTYDVLKNRDMLNILHSFDEKQELGIMLEVTPDFAFDAGVDYNESDSWHRAKSVFLTGYYQEDREKLIDKVFELFKREFGYFPASVGSWWSDAYSLNYLSNKYAVTSNLTVSDQLSLDEYTVWGTYYSTPYYPSKINAAYPAKTISSKVDIVMLRWAPRDPLNGFESPSKEKSAMYSTQDYETINLPFSYFRELSTFYATRQPYNEFAHLTIGLESDFEQGAYGRTYAKRLDVLPSLNAQVVNMRDFSDWYRNEFKDISPAHLLVADDLLGSDKKAFWFQTENYRSGLVFNSVSGELRIVDLRSYYSDFEEPFFKSPNRQDGLYILLPHHIDSVVEPKSLQTFQCGDYISASRVSLKFENCEVKFNKESVELIGKNIIFEVSDKWIVGPEGANVEKIGFRIPYGLLRRVPVPILNLSPIGIVVVTLLFIYLLLKHSNKKNTRVLVILMFAVFIIFLASRQKLTLSQSETEALRFLGTLPNTTVLVYNKDCLNCTWHTKHKPAGVAGFKKYVEKVRGKRVVESLILPLAKSPEDIKSELKRTNADYLYLVKYEDYIEQLPYPPESVGLEKLYENANVQILKVVK